MLRRTKKHFLFAELGDIYACALAVDRAQPPFRIEAACTFFGEEMEHCARKIREVAGTDRKSNFTQSSVMAYPPDRFLFRHVTDNPAKTKGDDYALRTMRDELHRKLDEQSYVCLNPKSGLPHDSVNVPSREVLWAGAPVGSIRDCQSKVLACGVYPKHLELGSLAIYAGIRHLLQQEVGGSSVLVIELGQKDFFAYVVDREGLALSESLPFGIDSMAEALKKELSLRDVASAQRMLLSQTFDFTDIGSHVLGDIVGRLRASTSEFEARTGKSISHVYLPLAAHGFTWVEEAFCRQLGLENWEPDIANLARAQQIDYAGVPEVTDNLLRWFPLLCLMSDFSPENRAVS